MINIKKLIKSFKFAFSGLGALLKKEQNFRVHVLAALVVIFFGCFFSIKLWQWCLIVLMITLVFLLEMMNTVFERLVDIYKPRLHTYAKEIKDIMSAMVLIVALASVIIALIIFIPYLFS